MLTYELSKIGEIIVKRNFDYQWAFKKVGINLFFYIDIEGKLIRWEQLDKAIYKKIPIGVFEDVLSTSRTRVREELPYLIFDKLELFLIPEAKAKYLTRLLDFAQETNEPEIDCTSNFIINFDWENFINNNNINEKCYFYIFIEKDKIYDPFENEFIAEKVNKFIFNQMVGEKEDIKDSVGRNGKMVQKASQVIAAGNKKMRLVTSKAYRENYYDRCPVARMSLLTDFYSQIAVEYLKENGALHLGSRWYALFSVQTGLLFPLFLTPKIIGKAVGVEVNSYETWLIAKEDILKKFRGEMIYVEFDVVSGARISTMACYERNSMDVELIKHNILEFIEKTVIWISPPKAFGDMVLTALKSKHNSRNITYSVQNEYSKYLQAVIRGDYQNVVKDSISPYIMKLIGNEEKEMDLKDLVDWSLNLVVKKDKDMPNEIEYDIGKLIGYAEIYEKLYLEKEGIIRNMLPEYLHNPRACWMRIWPRLIKSGVVKYPMNRIVSIYRYLELKEWGKEHKLDSWKIIEAYCLTQESFWEKKRNKKQLIEIINNCIKGEVTYIPLSDETDETESIRYKISIKEYKEE